MWSCVEGLICTGCGADAFSYNTTEVWQYFKIYETFDLWSYPLISVFNWKAHTHTHTHVYVCVCVCIYIYIYIYIEAGCKKQCLYDKLSNAKTDILDGYQGLYKTVIVCQSAAEVDELVTFLKSQCFQILAAHEDMAPHHNFGKYTFSFVIGIMFATCCNLICKYLDIMLSAQQQLVRTIHSISWRQTIHMETAVTQWTYYM